MPSAPSSPISKSKFTKVLIISDLSDLTTMITESSFLETNTSLPPIPQEDLIKYYDHMFPSLKMYCTFINQKLEPWQHILESKYFDSLH